MYKCKSAKSSMQIPSVSGRPDRITYVGLSDGALKGGERDGRNVCRCIQHVYSIRAYKIHLKNSITKLKIYYDRKRLSGRHGSYGSPLSGISHGRTIIVGQRRRTIGEEDMLFSISFLDHGVVNCCATYRRPIQTSNRLMVVIFFFIIYLFP